MTTAVRACSALRRLIASVLIATLAVVSVGPFLHAADGHDAEDALVVHDASQHAFSTESRPGEVPVENHCVACHWVRIVRAPHGWDVVDAFFLPPGALLPDQPPLLAAASSVLPLPARAPPVRG